jgi:flagellar hook-associated protein 3 FlgL
VSSIPSNLARVPNALASRLSLGGITNTNLAILRAQQQLSSGRAITRASDDPLRASTILAIGDRQAINAQQDRNLQLAEGILNQIDTELGNASDLVKTARDLASGQFGTLSDPAQRASLLGQIDTILRSLLTVSNSSSGGLYLFGGSTPSRQPVQQVAGGYQYVGQGSGLAPDVGLAASVPITLGGGAALGETSTRQRSTTDLAPALNPSATIAQLRGARGLGVSLGTINMRFNAGANLQVDLTGVASVADLQARLTGSIREYETTNSVTILGPGGVSLSGTSINIDVVSGGSLTLTDLGTGTTAVDLGLSQAAFTPANANGVGVAPRLSMQTPVAALSGVTIPMGLIRLRQTGGGATSIRDINLSTAQTVGDIRQAIESAGIGARVQISDDGTGLDIFNDIAGPSLSVEEIPGGPLTATQLGLRTFQASTTISTLNNGRGASIVNNVINPQTGLPDPALNTDLRITLGNGQYFNVDLRPQDMMTVQTVINRINAEFTAQIGTQPNGSAPVLAAGQFSIGLSDGPNGFAFTQSVGPGAIAVGTLNNSPAAEQLGLTNLTFDAANGNYVSQDRAGLRVDNVFSALIALRSAMANSSSSGMTLAGEDLGKALERLQIAQGVVGGYGNRVREQTTRLADTKIVDEQTRSDLMDTDFAEAATRLSSLSTQLEATLRTTSIARGRSLFDFLS